MVKEIRVHNQQVKMYGWDGGRSWCSSQKAILSFRKRRKQVFQTKLTARELEWFDTLDQPVDLQTERIW